MRACDSYLLSYYIIFVVNIYTAADASARWSSALLLTRAPSVIRGISSLRHSFDCLFLSHIIYVNTSRVRYIHTTRGRCHVGRIIREREKKTAREKSQTSFFSPVRAEIPRGATCLILYAFRILYIYIILLRFSHLSR